MTYMYCIYCEKYDTFLYKRISSHPHIAFVYTEYEISCKSKMNDYEIIRVASVKEAESVLSSGKPISFFSGDSVILNYRSRGLFTIVPYSNNICYPKV